MPESVSQRIGAMSQQLDLRQMLALITSMRTDLEALRAALNTHTHGGVTTGAGTSGVANAATVASLNTQP